MTTLTLSTIKLLLLMALSPMNSPVCDSIKERTNDTISADCSKTISCYELGLLPNTFKVFQKNNQIMAYKVYGEKWTRNNKTRRFEIIIDSIELEKIDYYKIGYNKYIEVCNGFYNIVKLKKRIKDNFWFDQNNEKWFNADYELKRKVIKSKIEHTTSKNSTWINSPDVDVQKFTHSNKQPRLNTCQEIGMWPYYVRYVLKGEKVYRCFIYSKYDYDKRHYTSIDSVKMTPVEDCIKISKRHYLFLSVYKGDTLCSSLYFRHSKSNKWFKENNDKWFNADCLLVRNRLLSRNHVPYLKYKTIIDNYYSRSRKNKKIVSPPVLRDL